MNVIIIEDEPLSADRLEKLIVGLRPDIQVLEQLDSVQSAVQWLKSNAHPDLLLCDIQLGDGLSLDIFQHVAVECPVIFTTAYDDYAIQAFKLNSIDYLLKPIKENDLKAALQKYDKLHKLAPEPDLMNNIKMLINKESASFKERFIVKIGENLHIIEVADIAFFMSEQKSTFITSSKGIHYPIEKSLDQLEHVLNTKQFFRISRKHLVNFEAIKNIVAYSSSRLRIIPHCNTNVELVVSREKVSDFKIWLEG